MKASFFPGCSLEGTAREYGESIDVVSSFLGIKLEELPGWTCCGASAAHCINEFLSVSLPARNLLLAEKLKHDLVTPCAACFSRLKAAEKALTKESKEIDASTPFRGEIKVLHLLEFFSREDLIEIIKDQVKRPLSNLKVVSYYGCLIVRPPQITDAKNWEDPQALDNLISLMGGESIFWPYKTECCGGSLLLTNLDIVRRLIGRILDMAREAEADCIVTACPLCLANLDTRQEEIGKAKGITYNLPVFYFTELLGLALGLKGTQRWFRRHLTDPRPLLKAKQLM
ncbi:MAG: CoB--CoM heterodisulfide reductase iron-sulfur subunit B family protein [Thermodesulfobacteriota bacterium]|jgi:heterodisulfide reductase subunit B|nr:MAG: CoB--CoM heterodisulfide reductase iron-sulfur subunit B family protein [Thermodesulfobacteriota bacterium]